MRARLCQILLLMLLSIANLQALAAPCLMAAADSAPHTAQQMHGDMLHGDSDGHHAEQRDADCVQTCDCCPGHCTSALPAGDVKAIAATPLTASDTYSDLNSSPAPKTSIRPPISR
jgi:hypothetical protein